MTNRYETDISNKEYHKERKGLSSTILREFMTSPAHAKNPPVIEDSFGARVHMAVLEPRKFKDTYTACVHDGRSKEGKEERRKIKESGKEIVSTSDFGACANILTACSGHIKVLELLGAGEKEISGFAVEPNLNLELKIRPDILLRDQKLICDLKTIGRGMTGWELEKHSYNKKWHIQAAFYLYVNKLITKEDYQFMHIYVETKAPYAIQLRIFSEATIDKALQEVVPTMKEYKNCLDSGKWPGYQIEPVTMELPPWALAEGE